jgi:hypothetical protein
VVGGVELLSGLDAEYGGEVGHVPQVGPARVAGFESIEPDLLFGDEGQDVDRRDGGVLPGVRDQVT